MEKRRGRGGGKDKEERGEGEINFVFEVSTLCRLSICHDYQLHLCIY